MRAAQRRDGPKGEAGEGAEMIRAYREARASERTGPRFADVVAWGQG